MMMQADLFVFASSCETFGISLLEAMAVGLPIACSNKSSLPETLQDGGEYFDPEDDQSIASAVKRLILDPVSRKKLLRVVERFLRNILGNDAQIKLGIILHRFTKDFRMAEYENFNCYDFIQSGKIFTCMY